MGTYLMGLFKKREFKEAPIRAPAQKGFSLDEIAQLKRVFGGNSNSSAGMNNFFVKMMEFEQMKKGLLDFENKRIETIKEQIREEYANSDDDSIPIEQIMKYFIPQNMGKAPASESVTPQLPEPSYQNDIRKDAVNNMNIDYRDLPKELPEKEKKKIDLLLGALSKKDLAKLKAEPDAYFNYMDEKLRGDK